MTSSVAAEITPEQPVSLFRKRTSKAKSSLRKRPATPPPAENGSDSSSGDYSSSEDDSGRRIKRRKKQVGTVTASSGAGGAANATSADSLEATKYAADRSKTLDLSNDATKHSNWYEEDPTLKAKNLLGSTRALPSTSTSNPSSTLTTTTTHPSNPTYKGAASYRTFIPPRNDSTAPSRGPVGPVKAPTNIRTITVTDFAPDVCKDYKQTGFCGFGDSCKFLHAREDYKQGWELDRDWEIGTKGSKKPPKGRTVASANRHPTDNDADADETRSEDDEALLATIPFACILCKKPYKNPIVTKCGHYFCEACALARFRKTPSCAACGAGTGGVFNGAKGLRKLLERKRERARRRREAGEGSEGEESDELENGEDGE
ncbi:MAG: RNA-splicing factor [Caeruleum heppii]|nr:MAG: RNA-splicing factor [Caeruleum heppii]